MKPSHRSSNTRVGIEFRSDGAYIAFVSASDGTVIGLGSSMYAAGTVVDGVIRQPGQASEAVERLLGRVHWARPPATSLAVPAIDETSGESIIEAPVVDGGTIGRATASAHHVDAAVNALGRTSADLELVDSVPVAVMRFARLAEQDPAMLFARGPAGRGTWTACADSSSIDVEVEAEEPTDPSGRGMLRFADVPDSPVVGPDPSSLSPLRWGGVPVAPKVAKAFTTPGRFVPAVAAALAVAGNGPTIDLAGPGATRSGGTIRDNNWGVEAVR